MIVSAGVEGLLDEAVVRRILREVGGDLGAVYGRNGKHALRQSIHGYNRAAFYSPWLVLVDLNGDFECAPPLRLAWLPDPAPRMCFRIAVREVEAWILADRERLAKFLAVSSDLVPRDPESVKEPKREVVELARRSGRRVIREDMLPRPGSGRDVGPAYASRLIEFIERYWNPGSAAQRADSLRRCLERLQELTHTDSDRAQP